eukprot:scaffold16861_cov76-Cyclotella_meneghiniana.AAC.1
MTSYPFFIMLMAACLCSKALAFIPIGTSIIHNPSSSTHHVCFSSKATINPIVEITFPTPDEAASMGVRDWPQTYHKSSWDEVVSEGQIATRYVLDGKGRVDVNYYDNNGREASRTDRIYPGTLVEVNGEARLSWTVDGNDGLLAGSGGF